MASGADAIEMSTLQPGPEPPYLYYDVPAHYQESTEIGYYKYWVDPVDGSVHVSIQVGGEWMLEVENPKWRPSPRVSHH